MKRVFIIHGYTGYPDKNWLPWLRSELERLGVEVQVPAMPNTENPVLGEWLPCLQQLVGKPDENTFFIGHSLGCAAILRYLESLEEGQKVGGVVLVAGFAEPIHFTELNSFTIGEWDDERIKNTTDNIVLISSDDDPHVPLVMGENMRDRFGAKLIVMHGADHINEKAGFTKLPGALEELRRMMEL